MERQGASGKGGGEGQYWSSTSVCPGDSSPDEWEEEDGERWTGRRAKGDTEVSGMDVDEEGRGKAKKESTGKLKKLKKARNGLVRSRSARLRMRGLMQSWDEEDEDYLGGEEEEEEEEKEEERKAQIRRCSSLGRKEGQMMLRMKRNRSSSFTCVAPITPLEDTRPVYPFLNLLSLKQQRRAASLRKRNPPPSRGKATFGSEESFFRNNGITSVQGGGVKGAMGGKEGRVWRSKAKDAGRPGQYSSVDEEALQYLRNISISGEEKRYHQQPEGVQAPGMEQDGETVAMGRGGKEGGREGGREGGSKRVRLWQ
eukprot:Nk52_evm16s2612 gene=Nk52_evmTU16s2612